MGPPGRLGTTAISCESPLYYVIFYLVSSVCSLPRLCLDPCTWGCTTYGFGARNGLRATGHRIYPVNLHAWKEAGTPSQESDQDRDEQPWALRAVHAVWDESCLRFVSLWSKLDVRELSKRVS